MNRVAFHSINPMVGIKLMNTKRMQWVSARRHVFQIWSWLVGMGLVATSCAPAIDDTPIDSAAYRGKIRLACVGDSITGSPGCWPNPIAKMLGPRWEVRNFGLGGGTLLSFGDYPYLSLKLPDVLAYAPDVVVVLLGTNDSKPRHWYYQKEVARDYRQLLAALKGLESSPRIWICLPPPAFPGQWGIDDQRLREMQPLIRRVARKMGIPLIDLYTPFVGRPERFPDQIHPDEKASQEIARHIYSALVGKAVPHDFATGTTPPADDQD